MSSILIIGDPHIGKGTSLGKTVIGSNLNSRILDQINLLDWSLQKAIENNITDIILTGDVFEDPKPQTSLITIFIDWIKKCQLHSINTHIIIGNHDILRSGAIYNSPLDIIERCDLEGVFLYRDINTLILDGIAVTFMPFRDRKSLFQSSNSDAIDMLKNQLLYELMSIPSTYKKIIVGHLALEGSIYIGDEIDDATNELICPLNLFEGYDYVWMGHVHKPQVLNNKPYIAHIGSMDISDFGEVDHEKKIVIFDTNLVDNFEYHSLPTRKLNKISILVPEDIEDVNSFILNEIEDKKLQLNNSIVKIEIDLQDKNKNVSKTQLEKFLISSGAFNVSSIVESKKQTSLKKESNKITNKMDVATAIKQYADSYIQESDRSSFIETAIEIYKEYQEQAS